MSASQSARMQNTRAAELAQTNIVQTLFMLPQQSDKWKPLETLRKCFQVISGLDLKLKARLTEERPHRLTGISGDSVLSCSPSSELTWVKCTHTQNTLTHTTFYRHIPKKCILMWIKDIWSSQNQINTYNAGETQWIMTLMLSIIILWKC